MVAYLSSGHYRQPLEFSERALAQAGPGSSGSATSSPSRGGRRRRRGRTPFVAERREAFLAALADDFNTPRAWAAVFELVAEGNRRPLAGAREALAELLPLLGLESLLEAADGADPEAEALLAERERARAERDFARADEIRDRLAALGWEVRDTPDGRAPACEGVSDAGDAARSSTGGGRSPRRGAGAGACTASGRADDTDAAELTRLAGSPDHQGVVAEVDPYPVRRRRGAARRAPTR